MDPIPQPYNGRANYRIVRAMLNPRTGRKKSAKATAEEQFPDMGWTIYNGHHSFTQDAKGMQ